MTSIVFRPPDNPFVVIVVIGDSGWTLIPFILDTTPREQIPEIEQVSNVCDILIIIGVEFYPESNIYTSIVV